MSNSQAVGIAPPVGAIEPAARERVGDKAEFLSRAALRASARIAVAGAMARARQVRADASRTLDAAELGEAGGASANEGISVDRSSAVARRTDNLRDDGGRDAPSLESIQAGI